MLKENMKQIIEDIKESKEFFLHNNKIFKCLRGDQLSVLKEAFTKTEDPRARQDKVDLAVSLNYIQKIVNKLSMLYTFDVEREPSSNQDLVDFYTKTLKINSNMQAANELYNGMKSVLIEIYQRKDKSLAIRPIPNDRFFVWSSDSIEPNIPEVYIKIQGMGKCLKGKESVEIYTAYSETEWLKFNNKGEVIDEGENIFGILPFVYINKDKYDIKPTPAKDLLQNVIQLNSILTDASVANYYQSFPIRVIKNADMDNARINVNPNSVIVLEPKPGSQLSPEFTEVPSSLDTSKSINLAKTILQELLYTFDLSVDGAVSESQSGLALTIKNVDTLENRKRQIEYFIPAEEELWSKIALIHNNIVKRNDANPKTPLTTFDTNFSMDIGFELPDTAVEQKNETMTEDQKSAEDNAGSSTKAMPVANKEDTQAED